MKRAWRIAKRGDHSGSGEPPKVNNSGQRPSPQTPHHGRREEFGRRGARAKAQGSPPCYILARYRNLPLKNNINKD
jgi:hypothetical protein